ncbi:homeobox-containing protein 1a isoform X3 [Alosa pseudoharengus]|uniref:homeobox-containing protein 1a isoform X3 n=1 Tax=Alosa pseudoharengus TaxID=34774 RepID=UPI003F8A1A56
MSHYTDEPRYTIEQIDLLQRLRRTGMTKPEILHALDTLERLDREHSDKFGRRPAPSLSAPPTNNGAPALANSLAVAAGNSNSSITASSSTAKTSSPLASSNCNASAAIAAATSTTSTATQTAYRGSALSPSSANNYDTSPPPMALPLSLPPPSMPTPMPVPTSAQNGRGDALAVMPNGKLSPPRYPVTSAPPRPYGYEPTEDELDIEDKVEELMRRDSAIIKEEIKAFLGNRRISQAVVAQVTGISQSRISHWLLQQGSDLSEQKKRAFFRWYQLEKTTPGATLNMRPAPLALEDIVEWRQTPPPLGSTPGSFRLRRGSRFTWRKECLAVMESYFNDNQYPDEAKREEIANACNAVIQKPGKKLSDLERVTSLKVYNWFANRRKEIKRRANIAAILETHGIDVQSPGGHSNSDDIDGGDYPEQVASDQTLGGRAVARAFGFSRGGLSSPTQEDGPAGHGGEHQDPITLAVEMAAVNHTILALAQQATAGASHIKTEVLDDD